MRKLTVSSGLSLRLSIFGDVPPTTPDGMWTFLAFLLMTDTENSEYFQVRARGDLSLVSDVTVSLGICGQTNK